MFNLWNMVKGRIAAWLVAVIVGAFSFIQLSPEHLDLIEAFVNSVLALLPLLVYAIGHVFSTKRKLDKGKIAVENVDNPRSL